MQKGVDFVGISVVYFCHDGKGKFVMAKRSEQARALFGRARRRPKARDLEGMAQLFVAHRPVLQAVRAAGGIEWSFGRQRGLER